MNLFARKNLDDLLRSVDTAPHQLRRSLGAGHVMLLGIGAIIGAGIFSTVGTAAAGDELRPGAGPSLTLSFVITACVCALSALCYAEFAALVPVSGSAYTYSYATLGELLAWIIGWDLIIEYAIGNTAVAIGWGAYFTRALSDGWGIHIPAWLTTDFRTAQGIPGLLENAPHLWGLPIVFNLPAAGIVMILTVVLIMGVRESATFNAVMVAIKLAVLLFFVGIALAFVSPNDMALNWQPFQPNGWKGTLAGAAIVFFAFIGFDAVSTLAEETRRPARDMPIGILGSLVICTVLYVIVSAVFTGLVPYPELKAQLAGQRAEPLSMALERAAPNQQWATTILALGAVVAQTAVLLVFQMGQPRIFMSMARDGLLPPVFAKVHPRFRTPHVTTLVTGLIVGGISGVTTIDEMVDLSNIGTLFAFVLVCVGIPILRYTDPHRPRPFRVPLGPWLIPILGAASCIGLMVYLPPTSWWRFVAWMLLGLSVYCSYGIAHSAINRARPNPLPTKPIAALGFFIAAVAAGLIPAEGALARAFNAGAWMWGVLFAVMAAGVLVGVFSLTRRPATRPE